MKEIYRQKNRDHFCCVKCSDATVTFASEVGKTVWWKSNAVEAAKAILKHFDEDVKPAASADCALVQEEISRLNKEIKAQDKELSAQDEEFVEQRNKLEAAGKQIKELEAEVERLKRYCEVVEKRVKENSELVDKVDAERQAQEERWKTLAGPYRNVVVDILGRD